jgi:hypothetical protein
MFYEIQSSTQRSPCEARDSCVVVIFLMVSEIATAGKEQVRRPRNDNYAKI